MHDILLSTIFRRLQMSAAPCSRSGFGPDGQSSIFLVQHLGCSWRLADSSIASVHGHRKPLARSHPMGNRPVA
jgi:hypothetical protein